MAFQPNSRPMADPSLTRAAATATVTAGPAPARAASALTPPGELALPPLPPAEPGVGTRPPNHLPPLPRD
jgi:hypothetical protein